jgi:hypothetical protein
VAQLGARFHGMEEVVGSIPTRSTIFNHLRQQLISVVPARGISRAGTSPAEVREMPSKRPKGGSTEMFVHS